MSENEKNLDTEAVDGIPAEEAPAVETPEEPADEGKLKG